MPILIHGKGLAVCPLTISLNEFSDLLSRLRGKNKWTPIAENACAHMIKHPHSEKRVRDFVKAVCNWGNDPRIMNKVWPQFSWRKARGNFLDARDKANQGLFSEALDRVTDIPGLGVSFGSKHLMFLAPQKAIILDKIISENLGYPLTGIGYEAFLNDCLELRKHVHKANIINPLTGKKRWRPCDIEGALFQKILDTRKK